MRIGMVCYSTFGGSGVLASELGKILANRGHRIHFITRGLPFRLRSTFDENIFCHPVEMQEYPLFGDSPYPLVLAARMAEIFRQEKLDLLHVHYAIPHATSAYLAQQMVAPLRLPIVTTLHGTEITMIGKDPSFFEITKFSMERSTVVTAVSDYLQRETMEKFQPRCKVHRVHNFVDLDFFRPISAECCCRRSRMVRDIKDPVVFFHLSNFRPIKRTPDVIRIFSRILQQAPSAMLLMVGEGPDRALCRQMVMELGLESRVQFLGDQQDIMGVLPLADVVLFPSQLESFGLVPLEAMACEIPVVASDSGGIPEVVEHGKCGFLAPVGNIEAFANYSIELAQNPDLRRRMGQWGRKRAEAVFQPAAIIDQYEKLYKQALNSP